jgi:hypothetical protein
MIMVMIKIVIINIGIIELLNNLMFNVNIGKIGIINGHFANGLI